MSYVVTQKQSESPSSSSVGSSPVLSGPLGVASTPSQSAPVKSSEGVSLIAQQARLPCRVRPQGRGRAWTFFQNREAQLPPPIPPPLPPHRSLHLRHPHHHPIPTPLDFHLHFLPPPRPAPTPYWASNTTQWSPERHQARQKSIDWSATKQNERNESTIKEKYHTLSAS